MIWLCPIFYVKIIGISALEGISLHSHLKSLSITTILRCFSQRTNIILYYLFCFFSEIESFVLVQLLSCAWLFATPWTEACQASLSFTISKNLLKLKSIESVMPSNHLTLCHPLLLLPSIFSSIRVFPNESAFHIRWPKYWSFSFSKRPSKEY